MRDAQRYQKELDLILQETEDKAKRATYLSGVADIEQLFEVATQRGMSQAEAWRIIDRSPNEESPDFPLKVAALV
jgi:hypothetical protein